MFAMFDQVNRSTSRRQRISAAVSDLFDDWMTAKPHQKQPAESTGRQRPEAWNGPGLRG